MGCAQELPVLWNLAFCSYWQSQSPVKPEAFPAPLSSPRDSRFFSAGSLFCKCACQRPRQSGVSVSTVYFPASSSASFHPSYVWGPLPFLTLKSLVGNGTPHPLHLCFWSKALFAVPRMFTFKSLLLIIWEFYVMHPNHRHLPAFPHPPPVPRDSPSNREKKEKKREKGVGGSSFCVVYTHWTWSHS